MNHIRSLACVLVLFALCTLPAVAHPVQQADDVTKTFQLTISGEVLPRTAFSVLYGQQFNRAVLYLCGPFEGTPDCSISAIPTANGTVVHFVDITWPRGTELYFTWRVHPGGVEDGTVFYEGVETLHGDLTNTAAYTFAATTPRPAPEQPGAPTQLPDTGLPGLPLAGLAAGVALVAGGVVVRRRR